MNLLLAITILFSDEPILKARLKYAARTISKLELNKDHGFLCVETVRALKKFKRVKE
jgi:hypothetical protein